MDWNSLKVFLSIVRGGSLSAAADELGLNHSTIFRRLNSFEETIGGRLFERSSHRYELTAMGRELLELAGPIESSFEALDRHLVGKDFKPKGVVRITAPNNISYRYLSRYLTEFSRQYPDIQLELLVSNQAFNMNNRQADIAVRATDKPPEHLLGRQLSNIHWSVFGSKAYQDRLGFPRHLNELAGHDLIGAAASMLKIPAYSWLDKHCAKQIVARSDDLTAMSCFAEAGLGLAILPNDQQRSELVKLFEFSACEPSKLWLLTHPDLRNVERIRLLMAFLAASFAKEWVDSQRLR